MPNFRVIGGPDDGTTWNIEFPTDGEYLYTRKLLDHVEHIY